MRFTSEKKFETGWKVRFRFHYYFGRRYLSCKSCFGLLLLKLCSVEHIENFPLGDTNLLWVSCEVTIIFNLYFCFYMLGWYRSLQKKILDGNRKREDMRIDSSTFSPKVLILIFLFVEVIKVIFYIIHTYYTSYKYQYIFF